MPNADLENLSNTISVISDAIVALSAIVIALFGYRGLKQWRAELRGDNQFTLAKKLAHLVFKFNREVHCLRHLPIDLKDFKDRYVRDDESLEEEDVNNELYARLNRLGSTTK